LTPLELRKEKEEKKTHGETFPWEKLSNLPYPRTPTTSSQGSFFFTMTHHMMHAEEYNVAKEDF